MNEKEIIEKLKSEGYKRVYIWNAEPGEMDKEHRHDFDTLLIVLDGQIQITSLIDGAVNNMSHQQGSHVFIGKNTPHSAKVGPEGCRYIVAESN